MSVTLSIHGRVLAALLATACLVPSVAGAQSRLPWPDANPLERWFGKPGEERPRARRQSPKTPAVRAAPAIPAIAAVPVPDARPDAPGEDVPEADGAVTPDVAATGKSAEPSTAEPTAGGSKTDDAPTGAAAAASEDVPADAPRPVVVDDAELGDTGKATPAEPAAPAAPTTEEGESAEAPKPESAAPAPAPSGSETPSPTPVRDPETPDAEPSDPATVDPIADPATTAEKPVTEIPVPEERPEGVSPEGQEEPTEPALPSEAPQDAPQASDPAPVSGAAVPLEEAPNATENLKARTPAIDPATAVLAAAAVADAELCEAELEKRGVEFTVEDSISEGECGVLRPLNVETLASGVKVSPNTQFLCRTALALDDWMTQSVVPAAKADFPKDKLTEFRHASTYVCRPRASERGISEHARGSAVDIAAFVFETREEIGIEAHAAGTPEARFQQAIREKACGPFKTVLGPGTDADHATHFHLDIAARSNGSTYCK